MSAVVLGRHRLYILPSRHGAVFGGADRATARRRQLPQRPVYLLTHPRRSRPGVHALHPSQPRASRSCRTLCAGVRQEEARFGVPGERRAYAHSGVWVTTPEGAIVRVTIGTAVCVGSAAGEAARPARGPPLWSRRLSAGAAALRSRHPAGAAVRDYPRPAPTNRGARALGRRLADGKRRRGRLRGQTRSARAFAAPHQLEGGGAPGHAGQALRRRRAETVWLDWEALAAHDRNA